jgi:hypothetical protein
VAFIRSAAIMIVFRTLHLTVIALVLLLELLPFLFHGNISSSLAGNLIAIVHTEPVFNPTAYKLPDQETA